MGKNNKKQKMLLVLLAMICLLAVLGYQKIKVKEIGSSKQIESLTIKDSDVTVNLNLPFYRSINSISTNQSVQDASIVEIRLEDRVDLSMTNMETIETNLSSYAEETKKINIINSKGDIIYTKDID